MVETAAAEPECPISLVPFEAEGPNKPYSLPCNHDISMQQLKEFLRQSNRGRAECPVCKHRLPSLRFEDYRPNYGMISMLNMLAEKRTEEQRVEQQRAEERRAEERRAEERRAEEQRAEQQRVEEEATQQRAQEQRAEEQRAEQQRREAEDRRSQEQHAQAPVDTPTPHATYGTTAAAAAERPAHPAPLPQYRPAGSNTPAALNPYDIYAIRVQEAEAAQAGPRRTSPSHSQYAMYAPDVSTDIVPTQQTITPPAASAAAAYPPPPLAFQPPLTPADTAYAGHANADIPLGPVPACENPYSLVAPGHPRMHAADASLPAARSMPHERPSATSSHRTQHGGHAAPQQTMAMYNSASMPHHYGAAQHAQHPLPLYTGASSSGVGDSSAPQGSDRFPSSGGARAQTEGSARFPSFAAPSGGDRDRRASADSGVKKSKSFVKAMRSSLGL